MKAVVVYESLWGNTAAIARAIADGLGSEARALTTDEATADAISGADLVVAGAPLLGFALPTDEMIKSIADNPANPESDTSHPSMRTWLDGLSGCAGGCAAFETRIWWSPGSAAKKIAAELEGAGFSAAASPEKFIVTGRYGPLKDGEIERAREWGAKLSESVH